MTNKNMARKNLYMSKELERWIISESEKTGMSQSAIMVNAIQFHKDYKDSLDGMEMIKELMQKVEQLEKES